MTGIDPQAETLLVKAAEDEVVLQFAGIPPGPFGFHVQQAAEKLIKALLSQLQIEFVRTHDLVELSGLLKQAGVGFTLVQCYSERLVSLCRCVSLRSSSANTGTRSF